MWVSACVCLCVCACHPMRACVPNACVCVCVCRVMSCSVVSCSVVSAVSCVCVCLCVHMCACLCACTLTVLPSRFSTYPHTHAHTHTLRPGPGVEAHDAARPGRARRGVCGQLLRRAAETPEHVLLSTGSGPDQAQTCLGFGKYALRRPERAFEAQRHVSGTSIFSPYVPRTMSLAAEQRPPEAGARRSLGGRGGGGGGNGRGGRGEGSGGSDSHGSWVPGPGLEWLGMILLWIHSFIHSCIHSFMYAFVHSFIQPSGTRTGTPEVSMVPKRRAPETGARL